ncbi:cupredoxin domain-containing protein [Bacillus benzoevorans]|uniref:Plastocyanin n=1 Tax=Bacillus benzoevorans TaxID=1456 RepID=A0A7X0HUG4_9BACI|nr:cupredoxin domain-containing protein [Bacillus benzoevorans]MBB6447109.1 plastocyanin [Bacillus benzoevorans]
MKLIYIRKRWLLSSFLILLLAFAGWQWSQPSAITTTGQVTNPENQFKINLVTGEFASKTEAGKEIEAYRWDPGTIVIPKGEEVTISIYGVNGKEHPFIIEGTDYKGTVQKGKETVFNARFEKEGTYRLICLTHSSIEKNGPMIGYIVVD